MTTYLDRLSSQLEEVVAKKRTATEKKQDERLLKRSLEEKAAKDDVRKKRDEKKKKDEKTQVAPEDKEEVTEPAVKEDTPKEEDKPKAKATEVAPKADAEQMADKLQGMKNPSLFLINSNITMVEGSGAEEGKEQYATFLQDEDENGLTVKEILSKSIHLSDAKRIHAWICDVQYLQTLQFIAGTPPGLEHFPNKKQITTIFDVTDPQPFKMMKLNELEGVTVPSELRRTLHEAWAPIAEVMAERVKGKETTKDDKDAEQDKEEQNQDDDRSLDEKILSDAKEALDKITAWTADTTLDDFKKQTTDFFDTAGDVVLQKHIIDENKDKDIPKWFADSHETVLDSFKKLDETITEKYDDGFKKMIQAWKAALEAKTTNKYIDFKIAQEAFQEFDAADDEKEDEDEKADDTDSKIAGKPFSIGKLRSLQDPHIFILDPRKKPVEYSDFLGPDKPGETEKASKILPEAIKFLESKQLKNETRPVIVYFLSGKMARDLKTELKNRETSKPFCPAFGKIDRALFEEENPFTGLVIEGINIDKRLTDEMNRVLMDATSEVSGNPIPVVQANNYVPINFFRLMNKKQRKIELYIGGRPEGAGYDNTIYVKAENETEANKFISVMKKFKMPSLFYERMSSNSDVDAPFKTVDPEEVVPSNVLILMAQTKFEPKAKDEKFKINQLTLLHKFAQDELGNKMKNPGTFVNGRYSIGTHLAQFNANMTVCFLWGSHTQHVTIDPKEVLEKLSFVKQVITSYL